jgi:putative two-component system response regulator
VAKTVKQPTHVSEEKRVAYLAERLALRCGICPAMAQLIGQAAEQHDIGKTKIPAAILNKPGRLDKKEFEIIKTHTFLGADILQSVPGTLGEMARMTALYHHEWHNGAGYWGVKTVDLPCYVSITAICDVFVALVSKRAYKQVWSLEQTIAHIQGKAGTHFDPELVPIFLALVQEDEQSQGNDAELFVGEAISSPPLCINL